MISFIKNIFKKVPIVDIGKLIQSGAQIIDVRTAAEYASGHLQKSMNVPLDTLEANMVKIKKDKPIITCCASGMRSGIARRLLLSYGYTEVYNGGSWARLKQYEK